MPDCSFSHASAGRCDCIAASSTVDGRAGATEAAVLTQHTGDAGRLPLLDDSLDDAMAALDGFEPYTAPSNKRANDNPAADDQQAKRHAEERSVREQLVEQAVEYDEAVAAEADAVDGNPQTAGEFAVYDRYSTAELSVNSSTNTATELYCIKLLPQ